jgi:NADH-quinone oxidoreductase subunit G
MCLTEPQAGSDLSMVRSKAVPESNGTYKIFGTKIYITYGEHDMAKNIIHLVLARTPDAPEGVKGISLFVVPKFLVNANGAGIESILSGDRRAILLMNIEPIADLPNPEQARVALAKANTVIALSAYKSADLLEMADVILPISTFTETVSTFVNAEGSAQTIQPAVKPLGDSRPAWKVLRVLGGLLNLDDFLYNMPEEVLGEALGENYCTKLSNQSTAAGLSNSNTGSLAGLERVSDVGIYAGDQIVRRSSALQLTRDAKRGNHVGLGQGLFTELGLKEGNAVRVTQGAQSVDLPVTLEANLAQGAVRISAGTMASAQLGSMFGPVTVSKA